jgi:ketosteroid isomerase-like protein
MRTSSKCFAKCMALVTLMLLTAANAVRAGTEDEVKALFAKFVAAQNAHDLKAVGDILQDSPQMFWITRGQVYLGRDAALKRFGEYYQGTWVLEPKVNEMKVIELTPTVAQLFAPTVFRIALPGQTAQPTLFLLNQIYVKEPSGWRLASIFPILVP